MSELARFQTDFAAALAADGPRGWTQGDDAGLAVYRNTRLKGAIDALQANFPAVAAMVGAAWFRAAAREYVEAQPPTSPLLHAYGAGFADWLEGFPPAGALPYLAATARLDRLWLESFFAADGPILEAQALGALDAEGLERTAARLGAPVRLFWSSHNSPTLWIATRWPDNESPQLEFAAEPQGVLISRRVDEMRSRVVDAAEFAFLAACGVGRSLAAAAEAALAADPTVDLPAVIARAIEDGVFTALEPAR